MLASAFEKTLCVYGDVTEGKGLRDRGRKFECSFASDLAQRGLRIFTDALILCPRAKPSDKLLAPTLNKRDPLKENLSPSNRLRL
jgi:hypothetical protein